MTVYNFGSINIDYVYRVPHFVQPGETLASLSLDTLLGGKGANQSVALARAGANVRHIGQVGAGDAWARDVLTEAGVDTSTVSLVDTASGHAIIQVNEAGENCIVLYGGANQGFDTQSLESALTNAGAGDWLLLQNECNALPEAIELAKARGLYVAFNPAPMDERVADLPLEACRLLILNEVEATSLAGTTDDSQAFEQLQARYPDTTLVVTLGAAGARLVENGTIREVAAPVVDAIDTTAAGDTFVGYCLAALIEGNAAEQALQRACAAAALSVTRAGAVPSIPKRHEVDAFIQETHHT